MKIYIGSDHAGYELKKKVDEYLRELGHEVEDKGAMTYNPDDDYPDFIRPVAEAVAKDAEKNSSTALGASRGIVIGGSGQGEAICANRTSGARATVFYGGRLPYEPADIKGKESFNPFEMVVLSRTHNDANVLSLAARFLLEEEAKKAIKIWLETPFEGGRHIRRIQKLDSA